MNKPADILRTIPALPKSWSELTWDQLCQVWSVKQKYGGNPDVARTAALLALTLGSRFKVQGSMVDERAGEQLYILKPQTYTVTPRELAHMAKKAMPWFDYPYGDPGEKEEKDEQGKVIKENRKAVHGYVGPMRDALILPIEELKIGHRWFALPQVACNNLTWHQYRSLQAIAPQLFKEGIDDATALSLQAQFLAHILVPRSFALLDKSGRTVKLRPHWVYEYDADRAEELVKWWEKQLSTLNTQHSTLFHVCFQVYQTAIAYYATSYPILFQDDGKHDPLRDALTGEVGTINTIMKYAGYSEQQQVYDSNLPFVLDILNTMTKEAKEIEKMNQKIKRK